MQEKGKTPNQRMGETQEDKDMFRVFDLLLFFFP